MLARLCYPVIASRHWFEFSKGYYARLSHQMHGQVTRLLMTPVIQALQSIVGHLPSDVSGRLPLSVGGIRDAG
jgi:glucosyl-3-phosphoglycerate synthase